MENMISGWMDYSPFHLGFLVLARKISLSGNSTPICGALKTGINEITLPTLTLKENNLRENYYYDFMVMGGLLLKKERCSLFLEDFPALAVSP